VTHVTHAAHSAQRRVGDAAWAVLPSVGACPTRRAQVILPGICEFDGRLSVLHYRGRVRLFARANLHVRSGARHVQTTSSADGATGWAPFELMRFGGVAAGHAENNIYFVLPVAWSVARTDGARDGGAGRDGAGREGAGRESAGREGEDALLGLFPAVLVGSGGGLYMSASYDGVQWAACAPHTGPPTEPALQTRTAASASEGCSIWFAERAADDRWGMLTLRCAGHASCSTRLLTTGARPTIRWRCAATGRARRARCMSSTGWRPSDAYTLVRSLLGIASMSSPERGSTTSCGRRWAPFSNSSSWCLLYPCFCKRLYVFTTWRPR
jgi:hypothetical protein